MPTAESLQKTATGTTASGVGGLDVAKQYFQNLMSGNRPALLTQAAPEISAINEQDAAQRQQQESMGTARGGGTASENQKRESDRLAEINNMLFGARSGAAAETGTLGAQEAGVGLGQTAEATNLLGLGTQAQEVAAGQGGQMTIDQGRLNAQADMALLNEIGDFASGFGWSGSSGAKGGIAHL